MDALGEESLLMKFVEVAKYFNPDEQIDKKSIYSQRNVDPEKIFKSLLI
jgi:hypothetical protein